ncbi:MAG: hypothetical protein IPG45_27990 [Deltaproteobacteria bacterium]|nr:hypothetical protein [Deltaproteobacteria bacterium]MBK6688348.1 hypothetical protein [Deltaproteobacteria bacterium]
METVFLLQHVYEPDGREEIKLIGVYSTREKAEAARSRVSGQAGFRDYPEGLVISEQHLDRDSWSEGFVRLVNIQVPLRGSTATVTAEAAILKSGAFEISQEPGESTKHWLFQPGDRVRCETRRDPDGTEQLFAMEVIAAS